MQTIRQIPALLALCAQGEAARKRGADSDTQDSEYAMFLPLDFEPLVLATWFFEDDAFAYSQAWQMSDFCAFYVNVDEPIKQGDSSAHELLELVKAIEERGWMLPPEQINDEEERAYWERMNQ